MKERLKLRTKNIDTLEKDKKTDKPGETAQEIDSTILTSSLPGGSSSSTNNKEKTPRLVKIEATIDRKNQDNVTETEFSLEKTNFDRKTLHQQKTLFDRKHDDRKTRDRKQEATTHADRNHEDRGRDSAYLQGSRPEADLEMLPGSFLSSPSS